MIDTVPCAPSVVPVTVSDWPASFAGPAESSPRTSTVEAPESSATVAVSAPATGLSLTSVTVTVTVAVSDFASATPLVVPSSVTV